MTDHFHLPAEKRGFLLVPEGFHAREGCSYITVAVYENGKLIGKLNLDESWFRSSGLKINSKWTSESLLKTCPNRFLDSVFSDNSKISCFYIVLLAGGCTLSEEIMGAREIRRLIDLDRSINPSFYRG